MTLFSSLSIVNNLVYIMQANCKDNQEMFFSVQSNLNEDPED